MGVSPVANGYQIHSQYPPLPGFTQLLPLFSFSSSPPSPSFFFFSSSALGNLLSSTAVRACSRVLRLLVLLLFSLSWSRCVFRQNPPVRLSSFYVDSSARNPQLTVLENLARQFFLSRFRFRLDRYISFHCNGRRSSFRSAIQPLSLVCSILCIPVHRPSLAYPH